jgi:hypothetical protein
MADTLRVGLSGHWQRQGEVPALTDVEPHLAAAPHVRGLTFDIIALTGWDSGLVSLVRRSLALDRPGRYHRALA